eukprot:6346904-Alexandrium_andersonii.AAC.1
MPFGPAGVSAGAGTLIGPPVAIPEKPAQKRPENACPLMARGHERDNPQCRAGKVHDPEAVVLDSAWQ